MKRIYVTIGVVLLFAFLSVLAVAKPNVDEGERCYRAKGSGRMQRVAMEIELAI